MVRKGKCRRWNAGTTTAVFRPQVQHPSFSTTTTPRQDSPPKPPTDSEIIHLPLSLTP
jgi:hypothetical protein